MGALAQDDERLNECLAAALPCDDGRIRWATTHDFESFTFQLICSVSLHRRWSPAGSH